MPIGDAHMSRLIKVKTNATAYKRPV